MACETWTNVPSYLSGQRPCFIIIGLNLLEILGTLVSDFIRKMISLHIIIFELEQVQHRAVRIREISPMLCYQLVKILKSNIIKHQFKPGNYKMMFDKQNWQNSLSDTL